MADQSGFLGALLDTSFSSFITTKIIRWVYVVGLVLIGLWALLFGVSMITTGMTGGMLLGVILIPVVFVISAVLLRIWLELVIVLFRIAEHVQSLAAASVERPETAGPTF